MIIIWLRNIFAAVVDWGMQNSQIFPEVFLAFVAILLAYPSYKQLRRDERKYHFKLADQNLAGNYAELSRTAGKFYKEQYSKKNKENLVVESLIYKQDYWVDDFANGLRDIDSITINYTEDRPLTFHNQTPNRRFHRKLKRMLPTPKLSLVENSIMYLEKSIWDHPTFMVRAIEAKKDKFCGRRFHRNSGYRKPVKTIKIKTQNKARKGVKVSGIEVFLDEYYDFYNTCIGLSYLESFESVMKPRRSSVNAFRAKLDLLDFTNRYCLVGVVTLTVVKGLEGGTKFLLHSRSTQVAEGRGLIHAVPAGAFQPPSTKEKLKESDLCQALNHNIIRETGEELFGYTEFTDCFSAELITKNALAKVMEDKIFYLGIGLNPLTTYLEILTLSVIDVNDGGTRAFLFDGIEKVKTKTEVLSTADFMQSLKMNEEGEISIRDFNKPTFESYADMYNAAPAFAQIARIVSMNFNAINDFIEKV